MQKGAGKRKGSAFERTVCLHLSRWVSNGQYDDLYWRSAMSGGRATVAHAKGRKLAAQAGDISCINPIGRALTDKFLIECKSYRDLNLIGLLTSKGLLAKFWVETRKNAEQYSKLPLLIAKQNQQPIMVCLESEGQAALMCDPVLIVPNLGLHITLFDAFLKTAHPMFLEL